MSALDGFYTAWSNARRTFGAGAPQDGEAYDASVDLHRLGAAVATAAPAAAWSGGAASAYDIANTRHRAALTRLAELDRRLGAHVDRSADVVTVGRRNLDALHRWVTDAAVGVPPGKLGEAMLVRIASRGLEQLGDVVTRTQAESATVAHHLRGLRDLYEDLFGETPQTDDPHGAEAARATDLSWGDIDRIDRANRELLQEMCDEYSRLPDGQVRTDRLADIAAIREALTVFDSHLLYLAKPADPAQMIPAATAVGDPFTADHVSVSVPGVSSTTRAAVAGMSREAEQLRLEATQIAEKAGASTAIATVAWVGYQPPPTLTSPDVLTDDLAQAGAQDLTAFLRDLDSASRNPGQTTALFGHSYGSLTSGIALGDGASAHVDNAVLYGSPGFHASSTADLGMRDDNFFVMSTPDDPINVIGALAPVHGWGSDPNEVIYGNVFGGDAPRYRFPHLETDAGWTPVPGHEHKTGASGHSDYPRDAGERMTGYNLAVILLDRPDLAVTETPRP